MSEERMVEVVQNALAARGIEDQLVAVGQFNPRGHTGGMFVAGLEGNRLPVTHSKDVIDALSG